MTGFLVSWIVSAFMWSKVVTGPAGSWDIYKESVLLAQAWQILELLSHSLLLHHHRWQVVNRRQLQPLHYPVVSPYGRLTLEWESPMCLERRRPTQTWAHLALLMTALGGQHGRLRMFHSPLSRSSSPPYYRHGRRRLGALIFFSMLLGGCALKTCRLLIVCQS